jgi:hypothetical protein
MPTTILILYSSIGSGHKIAADAIKERLEKKHKKINVVQKDIFSFSKIKVDPVSKINYRNRLAGNIYNFFWKEEGFAKITHKTIPLLKENFISLKKTNWQS